MSSTWSEAGSVGDGGVVISLEAIDEEAAEAAEARDFVRDLKKPREVDPRDRDAGTRAGCLYALAIPVVLLVSSLVSGAFESMGLSALAGFAVVPCVIAAVLLTRFWRAHSVRMQRARVRVFELVVTPSRVLVRADGAERYETASTSVVRFLGGRRLAIERTEARLDVMPLRLPSRDHDALATRLNELVREAAALGGGYRGNDRMRVAVSGGAEEDDDSHEANERTNARR